MKYLFLIVSLTVLSGLKVSAQQKSVEALLRGKMNQEEPGLSAKEVINHLNANIYIVDTIYKHQIVNKKLMYLYVGGSYANPELIVIVKGNNKELKVRARKDWTTGLIHLSGKAILYNGKPAVVVTSGYQFGMQIQI